MATVADELVQLQNLTYVVVGSLGVIIWDILVNVGIDCARIRRNGFSLVKGIYVLSRLSTLGLLFCETILQTASISPKQCLTLNHATTSLFTVYESTTHLILFFRLRAVYADTPSVVGTFFSFWMIVAGTSVLCPFAVSAVPFQIPSPGMSPRNTCVQRDVNMVFAQIILITGTAYANVLSLAISWRLLSYSTLPNPSTNDQRTTGHSPRMFKLKPCGVWGILSFISGERLPMFSKALLRDGQLHYLVMNTTNIASLIGISMKSITMVYRFSLVFPLIVVNNCMVCYVFRSVGTAAAEAIRYQQGMKESLPMFYHPFSPEVEGTGPTTGPSTTDGSNSSMLCSDPPLEGNTGIGVAL